MTLPHERLRSLGWGEELLLALQCDPEIPTSVVQQATELAQNYPAKSVLEALIDSKAPTLPTEHSAALLSAWELFNQMQRTRVGNETTRRRLLYTLRHFPRPGDLFLQSEAWPGSDIGEWIQHDQQTQVQAA